MRRLSILLLALALCTLVLSACSRTDEAAIRTAADDIREISGSAERAEAARAFLDANPTADPAILGDVAIDLVYSVGEARGHEAAIAAADSMLGADLPAFLRFSVEGVLATELLQNGTPDDITRADGISRRLLEQDVDHPYGYTHVASYWLRATPDTADADLWLPLDLAIKGVEKADGDWMGYAGSVLSHAYRNVFGRVEEARGAGGVHDVADSLLAVTRNPDAATHLRGKLYDLTVEDDPEAALEIAEAIDATKSDVTTGDVLNSVAFDLAERELAPGLAVSLAERSLELTTSRWDSIYVLDTVGWAHHKAGNSEQAVSHLTHALDLMGEDPAFDSDTIQHLLAVYDGAGDHDGSIDLLIALAARSRDEGAVAALADILTTRDGNADALERLLEEGRYAGIESAPAFTLPDRSGEMVALADLGGRVSLLCFWSYG